MAALALAWSRHATASGPLSEALARLDPDVVPAAEGERLSDMVRLEQRARLQAANDQSRADWLAIQTREDWERFRAARLEALRKSLGTLPQPPETLRVQVSKEIAGDGFRIENLVFESRPEWWVTANLYLPASPPDAMPGILICHSHHRPKEHGELQDMGMTWARAGCAVLVMDQLGHGERRQHPFATAQDFPREFAVSRQDYYFRYDTSLQLYLAGESLMGWMVWDLMRGVDLLLSRPHVDPRRIILLGAVAGGGDPAAVAAALDLRIACAVPFNFGGPQPETRYPLPEDAETSFNYAGSGSWESTRNLRRSAGGWGRSGAQPGAAASPGRFLPWEIVGSIAPRRLIFAHEFSWDRDRDPVWKRLQAIYGYYDQADHLAYTHGRGELRGQPPEATHCTHIGRSHRRLIHEAFARWFGITVAPEDEYSRNLPADELRCWTAEHQEMLRPKALVGLLPNLAAERLKAARDRRAALPVEQRLEALRADLIRVLGPIDTAGEVTVHSARSSTEELAGMAVHRIVLQTDPGILVPILLLVPLRADARPPVIIALAQSGKRGWLAEQADQLASLLEGGAAVCLPDLRGTGETRSGDGRGQDSSATPLSATELMLGRTMLGARLRDLRGVIEYLRQRPELDAARVGVWGDALVPANPQDAEFRVPRRIDGRPRESEPLGAALALLAGVFDEQISAVLARGGIAEFQAVLRQQFVYVPHDAVVPDLLTVADLPDLAAALRPRRLWLDHVVDEWNRPLPPATVREAYRAAFSAYRAIGRKSALHIGESRLTPSAWLLRQWSL